MNAHVKLFVCAYLHVIYLKHTTNSSRARVPLCSVLRKCVYRYTVACRKIGIVVFTCCNLSFGLIFLPFILRFECSHACVRRGYVVWMSDAWKPTRVVHAHLITRCCTYHVLHYLPAYILCRSKTTRRQPT